MKMSFFQSVRSRKPYNVFEIIVKIQAPESMLRSTKKLVRRTSRRNTASNTRFSVYFEQNFGQADLSFFQN